MGDDRVLTAKNITRAHPARLLKRQHPRRVLSPSGAFLYSLLLPQQVSISRKLLDDEQWDLESRELIQASKCVFTSIIQKTTNHR